MANRIRCIDSITEGVSRWASKRFGRSTRVSRGSVLLVNLMGAVGRGDGGGGFAAKH